MSWECIDEENIFRADECIYASIGEGGSSNYEGNILPDRKNSLKNIFSEHALAL